jgi:hypothetical protein
MDAKRIDQMMNSAQKQADSTKIVLDTLQQQRKGSLAALESVVDRLVKDTDKLTKPSLESENSGAILANTLRELIKCLSSTQLALDSHDKLMDMLINDLTSTITQLNGTTQGLLHTSMMAQTMLSTMIKKGVVTEDELKETHTEVAAMARESFAKAGAPFKSE